MKEEGNVSREKVSVKVEVPELACPEEGCGFEADTFNMLLFHQGWGFKFNSLNLGYIIKKHMFFFHLVTHIRTDIQR